MAADADHDRAFEMNYHDDAEWVAAMTGVNIRRAEYIDALEKAGLLHELDIPTRYTVDDNEYVLLLDVSKAIGALTRRIKADEKLLALLQFQEGVLH